MTGGHGGPGRRTTGVGGARSAARPLPACRTTDRVGPGVRSVARRADRRGALRRARRPDGAEAEPCSRRAASRGSRATTTGRVGPMAGVVSPSMWMFELDDDDARRDVVVLAQRGSRQGAAVRRLLPRRDRATALDGRRPRPGAAAGNPGPGPIDIKAIIAQMIQMGDEGHNRNRAGTLDAAQGVAARPDHVRARPRTDVAEVVRFVSGNDHFFLNLVHARLQAGRPRLRPAYPGRPS